MALRIGAIIAAVVLAYAYLLAHFYDLQITRAGYFTARAESEYRAADLLDAPAGLFILKTKA
ncbi:MAG: hypothetical protein KGI73_04210, partial [Patescibacteria group bacterium]|nr:hypothetical protein [Patescibacteria group bacterium]